MASDTKKLTINGFGSADLIARLQKAKWSPSMPAGNKFLCLSLGSYQLTDYSDFLCSIQYRVTLENLSSGRKFAVTGFGYPDLFSAIYMNGYIGVDGKELHQSPVKHYCRYRLTVEKMN